MTNLNQLLENYRDVSLGEREKGTYFEELTRSYLRHEPFYADLYEQVWLYGDWVRAHPELGFSAKDTGIDLVAQTRAGGDFHAIQCKFYGEDYRIQKKDIDSFFTASGQKPFVQRIIVTTTNNWSENAERSLENQQPPVTKIDRFALEASKIDWSRFVPDKPVVLKSDKKLRPHQTEALNRVLKGLVGTQEKPGAERGKLIMACGTGKTFTSLRIAEAAAGAGKRVLFLVPSLSLLSQTLSEWTQETTTPIHPFAVCSDTSVGRSRSDGNTDDTVHTYLHELPYPATTEPKRIATELISRHDDTHMSVVFSTYHSLERISEAQKKHGLPEFDLVICDEAHRTTGATFEGDDESAFVKIHDNNHIKAKKRLYMTATPRIYGELAKTKTDQGGVTLCSMDDPKLYGEELHVINFSEAVRRDLLCDYKVIVLTVEETYINKRLQALLTDDDNSLRVDDAAKIVGCWKALAKIGLSQDVGEDTSAMKRAVAFCQVIDPKTKTGKNVRGGHKVSSVQISDMFEPVINEYKKQAEAESLISALNCTAKHIDGSMNATEKEAKLNWLKEEPAADTCKILSNVRCLSEGVDVPALDAVLFLTPRNSQVDVVQSVGRVMRKSPGKTRGYVVLPVVIPTGMTPKQALDDNKVYKVVWDVLQALRSHDDQFDAMINKMDLMDKRSSKMEIIAVTQDVAKKAAKLSKEGKNAAAARGSQSIGSSANTQPVAQQQTLEFEVGEIERALYAKVVDKCGNRMHWEEWANDIAKIANTHIDRITQLVHSSDPKFADEQKAFRDFAAELRDDLNDQITDDEVIEMLGQHLITKPVFDALFSDYSFAKNNPVSQAMQHLLDLLDKQRLDKERSTLEGFYQSVKLRAEGIDNAQGKQKIVVELYDKFFRNAFPRLTERLGIVYTPVEVVDFILHSVNHLLKTEFNQTLGSEGVHILDPFTGTGTFITRLLHSGLIRSDQLEKKYRREIHANEIVLLAYYIAAVNIEASYHDLSSGEYTPFEGICLTDTFAMYETEDLISDQLRANSERRERQKALDIRVIVGNPPYSAGQDSANDNNANVTYSGLDERIRSTYAEQSRATNKNALYDSYIRAIRWASDQIGAHVDGGVIGFVTNAGFLEAGTADGLRKCLAEEFSSVHVFHLRGNARTQGETRRKEGGNAFDSGSRAPIAISLLVKNPKAKQDGQIYFHDIGDYLTREQKLAKLEELGSIAAVEQWQRITPDEHGDWLNQRDDSFGNFMVLGDKRGGETALFENYSRGLETGRDAWIYNFGKRDLTQNVQKFVLFYEAERSRLTDQILNDPVSPLRDVVDYDTTQISWTSSLITNLSRDIKLSADLNRLAVSLYRPFTKQWSMYDKDLVHRTGQMLNFFPNPGAHNLVIQVTGNGASEFTCLISSSVPDVQTIFNGQCFPLYLYEETVSVDEASPDLFAADTSASGLVRRPAITEAGLKHFTEFYAGEGLDREDIFYYIYGLLHSEDYRARFGDNLSKELPRIPRVKTAAGFWGFSRAGRELAALHLGYESVDKYLARVETRGKVEKPADYYRVTKMRHPKTKDEDGNSVNDLTTVIYNERITVSGIPLEAYAYMVNGKSAIGWVMDRQRVKTDKASGIVNDANDWAVDTMNNPMYPLELLLRVITVSVETVRIVKALPDLEID